MRPVSQGCSIGCDFCLTDPNHPDNNGSIPTKPITGNPPHADKAGFRKSYCDAPKTKSVLPKEYWTLNLHAIEGAINDSYQFNPWRGESASASNHLHQRCLRSDAFACLRLSTWVRSRRRSLWSSRWQVQADTCGGRLRLSDRGCAW